MVSWKPLHIFPFSCECSLIFTLLAVICYHDLLSCLTNWNSNHYANSWQFTFPFLSNFHTNSHPDIPFIDVYFWPSNICDYTYGQIFDLMRAISVIFIPIVCLISVKLHSLTSHPIYRNSFHIFSHQIATLLASTSSVLCCWKK